jgi:hypothetical protein
VHTVAGARYRKPHSKVLDFGVGSAKRTWNSTKKWIKRRRGLLSNVHPRDPRAVVRAVRTHDRAVRIPLARDPDPFANRLPRAERPDRRLADPESAQVDPPPIAVADHTCTQRRVAEPARSASRPDGDENHVIADESRAQGERSDAAMRGDRPVRCPPLRVSPLFFLHGQIPGSATRGHRGNRRPCRRSRQRGSDGSRRSH